MSGVDDEGIQFVAQGNSEPVICEICTRSLYGKTYLEKQAHYEQHFVDNTNTSSSSHTMNSPKSKPGNGHSIFSHIRKSNTTTFPAKENVFWHNLHDTNPPVNFTPGLIPVLKEALLKSHEKGSTVRAALCYDGTIHIATEGWDRGWGCGYRNFLMACAALVNQQVQPMYFPLLDSQLPPGVRNLQTWIEDAWKAGYDDEGATQLKHELVGTKKWIGTAELYTAFVYRGVPARLVEFVNTNKGAHLVTQWIERYFTSPYTVVPQSPVQEHRGNTVDDALRGATPVIVTNRMPLILQHSGHSRMVVGFEKHSNGNINLLLFDPSRAPNRALRQAALAGLHGSVSTVSSPHTHTFSPSKVMDKFLHAGQSGSGKLTSLKKRRAQEFDGESARIVKRVRGGLQDKNADVIIVDDGSNTNGIGSSPIHPSGSSQTQKLDPAKTLNFFRVNPKKIQSHDKYQILYFTLDDPLTEQEKQQRRIVTSQRIE